MFKVRPYKANQEIFEVYEESKGKKQGMVLFMDKQQADKLCDSLNDHFKNKDDVK